MVDVTTLWLPILLSATLIFVASAILHMVLPYHKNDMRRLPQAAEDDLLETLRRLGVPPGDYGAPHPGTYAGMNDPAYVEKVTKGPQAIMTIAPGAPPSMRNQLVQWFLQCVVVSLFAAYVGGLALGPGADYRGVFRVVSTVTFMGYALALPQQSIWYRRDWGTTLRDMLDGLIYGLLTAGVFGWLWPR